MRIISKFKDYYDHVGHRYGEDPMVTFTRGKTTPLAKEVRAHQCFESRRDDRTRTEYEAQIVVAGAHVFPMVQAWTRGNDFMGQPTSTVGYRPLDKAMLHWLVSGGSYGYKSKYYNEDYDWKEFSQWLDKLKSKLPEMMRECGSPVFKLHRVSHYRVNVAEHVPILKDLGIAAVVTPEQMWQDIYMAITTHMRPNPDKAPPVEISERDKIVKAGFDLKTSFRDPVNQKPKKKALR